MRLAVTVSARNGGRFLVEARRRAAEWGLELFHRPHRTGLEGFLGEVADAFLVLGANGWTLRDAHGELAFSPGLAMVRIKRLSSGKQAEDQLVRLGQLREGDVVVDGTLGLAADALVCARAVGPAGRVIGVEASLPLFVVLSEGLKRMKPFAQSCSVEVVHGRARDVLAAMPARSADVVVFDPMFDRPKKASPSFEVLRRFAVHEPLDAPTLAEARRVCRRWVLVKGGRFGQDFTRLGLTTEPASRYADILWARLPPV